MKRGKKVKEVGDGVKWFSTGGAAFVQETSQFISMEDSTQSPLGPEGNFPQITFHFVAAREQGEVFCSGLKCYGQRVAGDAKATLPP